MVSPPSTPRQHLGMSSAASLVILAGILLGRAHVGANGRAAPDNSVAAGSERGILNGVYSDEQRRKGVQVYINQCSTCHGERLRGGESAPALSGASFRDHWVGRTLDDLMQKVNLMPPKDPGRLTPDEAASVIAVILAANGFPPGTEELSSASNLLQQVRIESPKSP
jgi:mono/diheme cytochrome c family protein